MPPLSSKVVVDHSASDALLALAYREGLLTTTRENDGVLEKLASKAYPNWLVVQSLEQVVLFEQVHLPSLFSWLGVNGALVGSGPLYPIDELRQPEGGVKEIDPAILNGILKARGITPTPFEDPSIMQGVNIALQQLREWQEKYQEEPPSPISILTDQFLRRERTPEQKYVELRTIREPLQRFEPIAHALEEYLTVVVAAQDRAAFVMTPIFESQSQQLFQPEITEYEVNSPTILLRLTCSKLGVLPFRQTLKETLALARDPATIALRAKIQEWTDSLTKDSGADTERIQKEISRALSMLNKFGVGSTISNITTYIGIPVGLLAMISQFALAMGWVVTIAGTIGLSSSHAINYQYRWATFGSSHAA